MECTVDLDVARTFRLVSDFAQHERWIPLTSIKAPPSPLREGDEVAATTAWVLLDRMVVVELTPPDDVPGVLRVRKVGPVLLGDAVITVSAAGPHSAVVRWEEDVWLAGPLPIAWSRAALRPMLSLMLALVERGIRRDAAALARVRDRRLGLRG